MRKPAPVSPEDAAFIESKLAAGVPRSGVEKMLGLSSGALSGGWKTVGPSGPEQVQAAERWREEYHERSVRFYDMQRAAARDEEDPKRRVTGWRKDARRNLKP